MDVFSHERVRVILGDITDERVDAIVNAANSSLLGGSGVDGAIHLKGGPEIRAACEEIRRTTYPNGLPTGQAVITTAGRLPAKYVIHTVGPRYTGRPDDAETLAACYTNSLTLAVEHGLRTIAFPAISTGVYGYPPDEAAQIASHAVVTFLASDNTIEEVRLVFFNQKDAAAFMRNNRFQPA